MRKTPEIIETPDFETFRRDFVAFALTTLKKIDSFSEVQIRDLIAAFNSPNETIAIWTDLFILWRQTEVRNDNHKALQQFSVTVTDDEMIDLVVARLGVKRQVIQEEDTTVFPIKPEILESNKSVLARYAVAPYGLSSTGTRAGYKFHSLSVGGRPLIEIETLSPDKVTMTYTFKPDSNVERPKDANARSLEKNTGKVTNCVLSWSGNGVASQSLIDSVQKHITRGDIAQETDEVETVSASIVGYKVLLRVTEKNEPTHLIDRASLVEELNEYTEESHRLESTVHRSRFSQIAHNNNALTVEVVEPAADIECSWNQAPYCEGIDIEYVRRTETNSFT
ncbi:baseplate J/gp47 family protein [Vibrio lentus]|uniref:Phage-related baseplate assembly protein n=1 Tax=Vibrio tasmaniensis TaxID=212663 RepID=A0A0H4A1U9_9VIBR|nr:baseplate J/gp47 family protein [Vibrio lentus]AKN39736.1 Phage-related baseplate assembly protein [Vibrio tasmaniensis]PMI58303.1 hypothetical protein BCU41_03985 [Vibrio lentus]